MVAVQETAMQVAVDEVLGLKKSEGVRGVVVGGGSVRAVLAVVGLGVCGMFLL